MSGITNPNSSQLDQTQILQRAFNEAQDRLRVDASVTATIGDIVINAEESDIAIKDRVTDNLLKINSDGSIDANVVVSASGGDNIAISDGVDTLAINPDGSINVSGVATAANQTTEITHLSSIDGKIPSNLTVTSNRLIVDGSQVIQPVSATSLPLPTGAATEAKQDTQITILNSIDSGIPASLGQQSMANSMPVVLASDQTAFPLSSGAATSANQVTEIASLNSIDSKFNTLGQKLSSASVPVVLSSDNSNLTAGTIDGQQTGTKYTFVNNLKQQILDTHDRTQSITYADFGTKNERITRIDYASATISGFTARKDINYTLVSGKYRLDSVNWTIV